MPSVQSTTRVPHRGGLGIDLGTTHTVVHHWRQGVVFDEPSVLVLTPRRRLRPTVVSLGGEVLTLVGRAPAGMDVVRPLRDGAVQDLEVARAFLRVVLSRIPLRPWQRWRLPAVIALPVGATPLERRGLLEAAQEVRLRNVFLVPAPIAAAVGCGLDPMAPRTSLVVDIGGGTAEITACCFGGVLAHRSCRVAGDEMTEAVRNYLREQHRVVLGEYDAEMLKRQISLTTEPSVIVEGRDAASGRSRLLTLSVAEVLDAVRPITDLIVATLGACIDELPAQGLAEVNADGVLL
jgi:rod shape-determining protein MreB